MRTARPDLPDSKQGAPAGVEQAPPGVGVEQAPLDQRVTGGTTVTNSSVSIWGRRWAGVDEDARFPSMGRRCPGREAACKGGVVSIGAAAASEGEGAHGEEMGAKMKNSLKTFSIYIKLVMTILLFLMDG